MPHIVVDVVAEAFLRGWVGHETAGWLAYKYVPDNGRVIDAEISGPFAKHLPGKRPGKRVSRMNR